MPKQSPSENLIRARAEFDELVKDIRPELHRYCTRMTGSVIDGEDVVQEALAKAYYALPMMTSTANLRGWLFRIAHNKAIDHLRRLGRQEMEPLDDHVPLAEFDSPLETQEIATFALSVFLKLVPKQRSCVILKDVMGYSLAEISELLDLSIPAIKAALHRGRQRLRELAAHLTADEAALPLNTQEQTLLTHYIERFNARDFDTLRAMLAEDVRLDMPGRIKLQGAQEVGEYFHRYSEKEDWQLALGTLEGRLAILFFDITESASQPAYFILLNWHDGQISHIRDYRYTRYVTQDAEFTRL
ncbi:MAG: sigma-70 family RNA polymerase sigma factor [Anaerolineae bacterium]|nr:sigma-70 family RNA polymerase sigma factor [Anaerolineae bacterium]